MSQSKLFDYEDFYNFNWQKEDESSLWNEIWQLDNPPSISIAVNCEEKLDKKSCTFKDSQSLQSQPNANQTNQFNKMSTGTTKEMYKDEKSHEQQHDLEINEEQKNSLSATSPWCTILKDAKVSDIVSKQDNDNTHGKIQNNDENPPFFAFKQLTKNKSKDSEKVERFGRTDDRGKFNSNRSWTYLMIITIR